MTRVASITFETVPGAVLGDPGADVHNNFAHEIFGSTYAEEMMTRYTAAHAKHLATLMAALDAIPESDGSTVLDNTMIVWAGELADGAHGYDNYPVVIAGGGWAFGTGRVIRWAPKTPVKGLLWNGQLGTTMGEPHQPR